MSRKRIPYLFILNDTYKRCGKCRRYKLLKHFTKCIAMWDHLQPRCKDCCYIYWNLAYGRRKIGRIKKTRGRPLGFIVSAETRLKTSLSMKKRILTDEHRKKISESVMGNQNRRENYDTVVDDLYKDYVKDYSDEDVGKWIHDNKEALEKMDGVHTDWKMEGFKWKEVPCSNIDNVIYKRRN